MLGRHRSAAPAVLLLAGLALAPGAPVQGSGRPVATRLTADFAGDGAVETATASARGKTVRVELTGRAGKRVAEAEAPSPAARASVALAAGSLGSAGSLLEVSATGGGHVCRSVWRYRGGALARLPVEDGGKPLPDCEAAGQWKTRWEKKTPDQPARYVRERRRRTPEGLLVETRVFAFSGFRLERDEKGSSTAINGIEIPSWSGVELYAMSSLHSLQSRFDLRPLREGPRLRIETDRDRGVFALRFRDAAGEIRMPVTASRPIEKESRVVLEAGKPPASAAVLLARGSIPQEVVVKGAGERFDGSYAPVIHWSERSIEVYPDAEQELASEALPGTWTTMKNDRVEVRTIPGHACVRFGQTDVSLDIEGAPEGTDLLLLPRDGGSPSWAITLRGPNGLSRTPVRCEGGPEFPRRCQTAGPGQALWRVGGLLNVR